jgi:hypothetical protein
MRRRMRALTPTASRSDPGMPASFAKLLLYGGGQVMFVRSSGRVEALRSVGASCEVGVQASYDVCSRFLCLLSIGEVSGF